MLLITFGNPRSAGENLKNFSPSSRLRPLPKVPIQIALSESAYNAQTVSLTMKLAVPAGAELFKCQFMKMPKVREGESYVIGVSHKYDPGSHHFIVYRTDVKTMEPGMEQQVDNRRVFAATIVADGGVPR